MCLSSEDLFAVLITIFRSPGGRRDNTSGLLHHWVPLPHRVCVHQLVPHVSV